MNDLQRAPHPSSPSFDGLTQGLLRYLCCIACGAPQTLTRAACSRCGGLPLEWRDAGGKGTVYASTVVHRAPTEDFRPLVPYTLVLVDLNEGPRVMAHGAAGLAIGDRVYARIRPHAGGQLLTFYPDEAR